MAARPSAGAGEGGGDGDGEGVGEDEDEGEGVGVGEGEGEGEGVGVGGDVGGGLDIADLCPLAARPAVCLRRDRRTRIQDTRSAASAVDKRALSQTSDSCVFAISAESPDDHRAVTERGSRHRRRCGLSGRTDGGRRC
jgi:hypothetical protein